MECRGGCFLAGALVETPTGRRPIESIHVGDEVLSRDERTGEVGCREVRRTYEGRASSFVRIGLLSSETGSGQTLRCTAEHPLRVVDHGWVTAGALRVGDRLVSSSGAALDVVLVQVVVEDVGYFNLEVEGTHTYFVAGDVSAPAVWVHNACDYGRARALHAEAKGNLLLRDLSSHGPIGGLHGGGGDPAAHARRLGLQLTTEFNAAEAAAQPIALAFKTVDGRLVGHVNAGQHRILGLIDRLGPNARVRDIPQGAWREIVPSEHFETWLRKAPSMGEHFDSLFPGGSP